LHIPVLSHGQTAFFFFLSMKKGLVQFKSHNCLDTSQSYITTIRPMCLKKPTIITVSVNQPTIYNLFNGQQIVKLLRTFIDLAVHDDNWLTRVPLFENVSCFFGQHHPVSREVSKGVWNSNYTRSFLSLPYEKEKKKWSSLAKLS